MPKKINITEHAAQRYLERIVGLPITDANIRAAQLFLSFILANRICLMFGKKVTTKWTRLSLLYKDVVFIYDPVSKRVYTIKPAKSAREKLEMYLQIPSDFSVGPGIRIGSKLHGRLFRHKWPIIGACRTSLRLQICAREVIVDLKRKIVSAPYLAEHVDREPVTLDENEKKGVPENGPLKLENRIMVEQCAGADITGM